MVNLMDKVNIVGKMEIHMKGHSKKDLAKGLA